MTNWKIFQITSRHPSPNYIVFWLDECVNYSNGSEKYIYCENTYPYCDWEAGDDIKVDIDRTCYYKSGHYFSIITA